MEISVSGIAANSFALMKRSVVAIGVAGTVAGVLRARGNGNTAPSYGGWTTIDPKEFETIPGMGKESEEGIAPVIPLHSKASEELTPAPRRVIGIADIPSGPPSRPDLSVVGHLIDVEDIPQA